MQHSDRAQQGWAGVPGSEILRVRSGVQISHKEQVQRLNHEQNKVPGMIYFQATLVLGQ
jgi:hypothetical protein